MIFIMSDIHGQLTLYKAMIEKLNIKESDTVYVLGDVIDRGRDGIKILQSIMRRPNFELFLGNHEWFMLDTVAGDKEFTQDWLRSNNGGLMTYRAWWKLSQKEREEIVDYLQNHTHLVKNLDINGHRYVLSHTGMHLSGKDIETKDMPDLMQKFSIVWNEHKYWLGYLPVQQPVDPPVTLISGHICTRRITGKDEIYIESHHNGYTWIDIDCGCAYGDENSRLACLCIDDDGVLQTDSVVYVSQKY